MQDYKQKSKQSFDLQAETYDHDKNGLHARNQYQAILEKVKEFQLGKVLDVGCGTGGRVHETVLRNQVDPSYR